MSGIGAAFAASCAVLSPHPAGVFAPKDGQPYRYVTTHSRSDGTVQRSFTAERHVRFTRLGAGWRAELVLDRTSQTAGGDIGSMFQSAMASLIARPVQFDLDSAGCILRVDGLADLWAEIVAGIATMLPKGAGASGRRADTLAIEHQLRALPADRQQEMIASMLLPLIDPAGGMLAPGRRRVLVPAAPPGGPATDLDGTETITRDAVGTISIETSAAGAAPKVAGDVTGADRAAPDIIATVTLHTAALRRIDPATGLVVYRRDGSETCTNGRARPHCISTVTEVALTSLVL